MTHLCQFGTKTTLLVTMFVTSASTAFAQPNTAQTFEQLQMLVSIGDSVKVTDREGNRITGGISDISGSRLILDVNGTKRTLDEAAVREIRRRGGDSLANGAWWGFGVGAGIGTLGLVTWCATESCSAGAFAIIPTYGALGAGIGVGVDALIRGERVLYRAPWRRAMSVAPMFGRRTGVGVSVSF